MDVNNTRFFLVRQRGEWLENSMNSAITSSSTSLPSYTDVSWDSYLAAVGLTPRLFRFPNPPGNPVLTPAHRRGSARDMYDNWYWISQSRTEIRTQSLDKTNSDHFWQAEDQFITCCKTPKETSGAFLPVDPPPLPAPLRFSGLTVTCYHYLIVGVLDPPGFLVFDLHAGGPPTQYIWPGTQPQYTPFAPFDISPSIDGGAWILDSMHSCIWKLDRYFRVANNGEPFPIPTSFAVSIESLPDGSLLLLENDPMKSFSTVYLLTIDEKNRTLHSTSQSLEESVLQQDFFDSSAPFVLKGHDLAYVVPDNMIYITDPGGNQAFAFRLVSRDPQLILEMQPYYLPMRYYAGKALVADAEEVYYDTTDRWFPLAPMPRPRFHEYGEITLSPFNGKEPGCQWHRIVIDAYIPPGTSLVVKCRVTDNKNLLETMPWQEQPRPYLRGQGAELPYYDPFKLSQLSPDGLGTWELLFQDIKGQYMQVHFALVGTGNATPYLYAARIYYPRFSYLKQYLPSVYRENDTSASFLDRFLANIEGLYTTLEGRIAQAQVLFDVNTSASEYLDWLAQWFGILLDPAWEEDRRRLFLRHAIELFNQRGTLAGLIRTLRLSIDPCPDDTLFQEDVLNQCPNKSSLYSVRIVEGFLTRSQPGVVYGDPTDVPQPGFDLSQKKWTTAQGSEPLHQLYRQFLENVYKSDIKTLNTAWEKEKENQYQSFQEISLSPVKPSAVSKQEILDWLRFLSSSVGFTYFPVDPGEYSHQIAYKNFLARRYAQVTRLNQAYAIDPAAVPLNSFEDIRLPMEAFPYTGTPFNDWIQFVSQVLPIKEKAHWFTVLVPHFPGDDEEKFQLQLEQVKRIVEREKPAHTNFIVKPYWALFRVGEARVGLDTVPGPGSRYTSFMLGRDALAGSYIAAPHPWEITDRFVTGREQVKKGNHAQ